MTMTIASKMKCVQMRAADGIGDELRVSYYQSTSPALAVPERF